MQTVFVKTHRYGSNQGIDLMIPAKRRRLQLFLLLTGFGLFILLLGVVFTPQSYWCDETGLLRLTIHVEDNGVGGKSASGYLVGKGASRHSARRNHIAIYSQPDVWNIEPDEGSSIVLDRNCRWQASDLPDEPVFLVYLVDRRFQPPNTIAVRDGTLPPEQVGDDRYLLWTVWEEPVSAEITQNAHADALAWLHNHFPVHHNIQPILPTREGLIVSYDIEREFEGYDALHARSWLYDNALTAIALLHSEQYVDAQTIFNTMSGLVRPDGSLGFSYNTHNEWFHENYQTGAIAWMGYAWMYALKTTDDTQAIEPATTIANYLIDLQDTRRNSPTYGSLPVTADSTTYATENNIAAWFFLQELADATGTMRVQRAADRLRDALLTTHWNDTFGRFDESVGDSADGLIDANALGLLFLQAQGETNRASRVFDYLESTYAVNPTGTHAGFAPYSDGKAVYSQGTLQMALAYRRSGNEERYQVIMDAMRAVQTPTGGIPYALPAAEVHTGIPFREWPGAGATAWFALAAGHDNGAFFGR